MKIGIIGCSGGPDSMALLDILRKEGNMQCVVAHVNYKKRDTADRDQRYVESYCRENGIFFHVLKPVWEGKENFQSWARDVRYKFFEDLAKQYNTNDIYIAHQKDDMIETYLMQKERKILCDTFGFRTDVKRKEYTIHRPLLSYSKKELEEYCIQNKVCYGIDESNLGNDYKRNRLRHSVIEYMTEKEKQEIMDTIQKENEEWDIYKQEIQKFLNQWDNQVSSLLERRDDWLCLETYLFEKTNTHYGKDHMQSLCKQIRSDCVIDLQEYELESFHGKIYFSKKEKLDDVVFSREIQYGTYEDFCISSKGTRIESVCLSEKDFPIMIRCGKPGDSIALRYGKKKLSRFFVDRKIPHIYRKKWRVIENSEKKVIFIPGIGCDKEHFSANSRVFMIQCHLYLRR